MSRRIWVKPMDTVSGWRIPTQDRLQALAAATGDAKAEFFRIEPAELFGLVLCAALLRSGYVVETHDPPPPPREFAAIQSLSATVREQMRSGRKP